MIDKNESTMPMVVDYSKDGHADAIIAVGANGAYVVLAVLNDPNSLVLEELRVSTESCVIEFGPGVYYIKFCVVFHKGLFGISHFEDVRRLADGADLPELLCPIQAESRHAVPCCWCGQDGVSRRLLLKVKYTDKPANIGGVRAECDCGHCGPRVYGAVDMGTVSRAVAAWNAVNTPI